MIKVIVQGLGPIGKETAKLLLKNTEIQIVQAIDINPEIIGKDLGDVLGLKRTGIKVTDELDGRADVLVLATASQLGSILPAIESAVERGINVVTAAEELFYPEHVDKAKAAYLDKLAIKNNVAVVGRGVNPGLLMDLYPLSLFKGNFSELNTMHVCRWDNTIERRLPLLEKTGAGMTEGEFKRKIKGHVGLEMSAAYLADKIDVKNYKMAFERKPVIAEKPIKPQNRAIIEAGRVVGLNETCTVARNGVSIRLDLRMYVGAEKNNSTMINGRKFDYSNIVNGDIATVRILADLVQKIFKSPPGLNKLEYIPEPLDLLVSPNN
ncbi:MAG: hypothetical protein NTW86_15190 [Candidatus Sumerlaeota bacterium]|nr:hypothetical protein [Candidatus Sumerlaeota bacterium]